VVSFAMASEVEEFVRGVGSVAVEGGEGLMDESS